MPIAAVPSYLKGGDEQFYLHAPAGHRFSLYFPVWGLDAKPGATPTWKLEEVTQQRKKGKKGQPDAWEDKAVDNKHWACTVTAGKKPDEGPDLKRHLVPKNDYGLRKWLDLLRSLRERQNELAEQAAVVHTIDAVSIAPFTTGLGNEHPLENGFAFLNPYGLPYLPGSGVKGVVRRAAEELATGMWGDTKGWSAAAVCPFKRRKPNGGLEDVKDERGQPIRLSMLDVLFGREPPSGDSNAVRGALSFWDVIPQIEGASLLVEVMTPHQSHYYQWKKDRQGNLIEESPHDSGQPTPICFLTVPPGSRFTFHVICDSAHLKRLTEHCDASAPDLLADEAGRSRWQGLLEAAFQHAFEWLGFGAKTAVGYGAMRRDQEAEEKAAKERERRDEEAQRQRAAAEEEARRAAMTENMRRIDDFARRCAARAEQLRGGKDKPNTACHQEAQKLAKDAREARSWTPEERRAAADAIEQWLPKVVSVEMKEERKKLRLDALRGAV